MSNVIETPAPTTPAPVAPTKYTVDAVERMERLRQIAAEFPAETDLRPLTRSELTIASQTTLQALEQAAVLAQAVPRINNDILDVDEVRDVASFELAYIGMENEARALLRRIKLAVLRKKLRVAIAARELYKVAKSHAASDAVVKTHVTELKRTLFPRRKKTASAPAEVVEVTATKK